jgi:tetraacyldisaccharide 4'-kinase
LSVLSALYGRAARLRRAWYERHPHLRRRLAQPVISVGNLVVGGSGKTPAVAAIARLLLAAGEHPVILSRGYGRRRFADGVVVVSDGIRVLEPTTRSGDEPQMLARSLDGVPVLVSRERFLAGRLAERRFDATVHILDDGFQHLQLTRDVDLVIVSKADLDEAILPAGNLRESVITVRQAHAMLVPGSDEDATVVWARVSPVAGGSSPHDAPELFRIRTYYDALRPVHSGDALRVGAGGGRVIAVAGIARPERFFAALRAQGWEIVREMVFRDHHWFSDRDVQAITRAAAAADVDCVVTTEKDATRLSLPSLFYLPMRVAIEPDDRFGEWLASRLAVARARRRVAA